MKVKNADEFYKILERKAIYPVFQPIVNLQTVPLWNEQHE